MSETVLIRSSEPILVVAPVESRTVMVQPAQTTVQVTVSGGESSLISQEQGPAGVQGPQGVQGPPGPMGPMGEVTNALLDGGNF